MEGTLSGFDRRRGDEESGRGVGDDRAASQGAGVRSGSRGTCNAVRTRWPAIWFSGGWRPRAGRGPRLAGLETWLEERLKANSGNADVVRQQLAGEKGIVVGLRTVQRAVRGFRRELRACERATVRFETAPGYQMQIDFGVRRVPVGDAPVAVHLFVATLGYSRRQYARGVRGRVAAVVETVRITNDGYDFVNAIDKNKSLRAKLAELLQKGKPFADAARMIIALMQQGE